jgi:hypothetical protein
MTSLVSRADYFFPIIIATGFASATAPITQNLENSLYLAWLLEGIDIWPLIIPQTATVTVTVPAPNGIAPTCQIWGISQSTSLPGPWSWRGAIGMPARGGPITVDATGSFGFNMWGRKIPDWSNQ